MSRKTKRKKDKGNSVSSPKYVLFTFFTMVVFILIPLIYVSGTLDGVQPIRLLVISLFLIIFGGMLVLGKRLKTMPAVVWHNLLVWMLLAYLLVTIVTAFWAINIRETYFDIAKTLAFFVFTLFLSAILFNTDDWQGKITKYIIVAACISVAVGIYQILVYVIGAKTDFLPDEIGRAHV